MFAYAKNNPVMMVDPSGYCAVWTKDTADKLGNWFREKGEDLVDFGLGIKDIYKASKIAEPLLEATKGGNVQIFGSTRMLSKLGSKQIFKDIFRATRANTGKFVKGIGKSTLKAGGLAFALNGAFNYMDIGAFNEDFWITTLIDTGIDLASALAATGIVTGLAYLAVIAFGITAVPGVIIVGATVLLALGISELIQLGNRKAQKSLGWDYY